MNDLIHSSLLARHPNSVKPIQTPLFNLVYYVGTRKIETIAWGKPKAICNYIKQQKSINYKVGTFKLEEHDTKRTQVIKRLS